MADAICRWRNGTPKTVVELVNSMPHEVLPIDAFRRVMANSVQWGNSFFRTAYQLAVQLALYYESEDGFFYPRFDHQIDEEEADAYLRSWFPKYYVPKHANLMVICAGNPSKLPGSLCKGAPLY